MTAPDDPLELPAFLRRGPGAPMPRERRKRLKAHRPDGEVWASAERWEVHIGHELSHTMPSGRAYGLACGLRRVWVVEGRKWVRLCDGTDKVKVPLETWRRLQRHARQLPA